MTLSLNSFSNFTKVLSACGDVDELEDLLGKQLDLEIESNGKYPKVVGYYRTDDEMSGQPAISERNTLFYSVEDHKPDTLKKLHRDLKQTISLRIIIKE